MRYLFGDYTLDKSRCELHRTGRRIPLRPKVFDVLSYLIAHRDCVVSQQASSSTCGLSSSSATRH